jgi:hypothetical protein
MYSSPLTKDQKPKKPMEGIPKEKFKISLATTRKVLKIKGVSLGESDMKWLNGYMENKVRGECLPLSFWSNDLLSELPKCLGSEGATKFIDAIKTAFHAQCRPILESASEHDEPLLKIEGNSCTRKPTGLIFEYL